MKSLKSILILCLFFMLSCGNSSADVAVKCNTAFSEEFQTELTNISNAVSAYGQDQSAANCESLKEAYLDYIDALEDWDECATLNNSAAEYDAALDSARMSINSLVC